MQNVRQPLNKKCNWNTKIGKKWNHIKCSIKTTKKWGFPGGAVVENLPANAGDTGSSPGQGTRSHMHAATKSSHATTKEPACHN